VRVSKDDEGSVESLRAFSKEEKERILQDCIDNPSKYMEDINIMAVESKDRSNKAIIKDILKKIESQFNVQILFAVENGSRAWGIESIDSDYDIRFVFKRQAKEYLTWQRPEDVISCSFDRYGISTVQAGALFDCVGFDILKFGELLSKSNPQAIEWLITPILYSEQRNNAFETIAMRYFNVNALFFHYRSMCEQNYLKYIKLKHRVSDKKYIYAMRGLVNAKWVSEYKTLPPVLFEEAIKKASVCPPHIRSILRDMIKRKKGRLETIFHNKNEVLDIHIESFLKKFPKHTEHKTHSSPAEAIKEEIQRILV
jgi:hypothetical protein